MTKKPASAGFFVSIIDRMNSRYLPGAHSIINGLLVLLATLMFMVTLYVLAVGHWHGPFRDMWEIYPFLNKIIDSSWTFSDLWESYGFSHRLLIPKLLYIADYYYANASNHLLIVISTLSQCFIVIIFASAIRKSLPDPGVWIPLSAIVVIFQFSGSLLFNWFHTFDVQWFVCALFVTASLYVVTKILAGTGSSTDIVIAMGLLMAACLCNFSAMAAWPLWIYAVHRSKTSIFTKAFLMSAVSAYIFIYTHNIKTSTPEISDAIFFLKYVAYILIYFPALYLTNPLSDPDYINFSYLPIIAIALVAILMAFYILKNAYHKSFSEIFLFMVMLFCVGVSIITAIGRGYDPSHVKAMRYQNIVVLFWSAAIPFLYFQSMAYARKIKIIILVTAIVVLSGFLVNQTRFWDENLKLAKNVDGAHLALMMGYSSNVPMIAPTVSRSMIYVPGYSLEKERYLHERSRKGIYHGELADYWLGYKDASLISNVCGDVSVRISRYTGDYASYNSLAVTGAVSDYDAALLRDATGKAVAAALPERPGNLIGIWQYYVEQPHVPGMKGYALDAAVPVELLLLHRDGRTHCKKLLPGY